MLAYYLVACLLLFLSYRGQCFFRHLFNWPWFCQLRRWWQSPARYVVYFLSAPPCLFPFVFHLSIVFETLMLEKVDGRGRRGWQDGRLGGITDTWTGVGADSGRWVKDREAWRAAVLGVTKSQTQLSDWTTNVNFIW